LALIFQQFELYMNSLELSDFVLNIYLSVNNTRQSSTTQLSNVYYDRIEIVSQNTRVDCIFLSIIFWTFGLNT